MYKLEDNGSVRSKEKRKKGMIWPDSLHNHKKSHLIGRAGTANTLNKLIWYCCQWCLHPRFQDLGVVLPCQTLHIDNSRHFPWEQRQTLPLWSASLNHTILSICQREVKFLSKFSPRSKVLGLAGFGYQSSAGNLHGGRSKRSTQRTWMILWLYSYEWCRGNQTVDKNEKKW